LLINRFVTISHPLHTKVIEYMLPARLTVKLINPSDRLYKFFNTVNQKARLSMGNYL
jgi:hypothetical protein